MKKFKDEYMNATEVGRALVKEYYEVAPRIVERMKGRSDRQEIFTKVYKEMIEPCVKLIENGKYEDAKMLYMVYTLKLSQMVGG